MASRTGKIELICYPVPDRSSVRCRHRTVDAEEYAAKMVDETVKEAVEVLQREATEIANQHHEVMRGMTEREAAEYVKRVIANAPLVFGVYQDAESPNGVGMYVIKGRRELQASIAAGLPIQIEVNAIHCIEREQAIAAAEAYGDGQML